MTVEHVGTRFVGRERELADLAGLLNESASGRGHLVLIGGEPGIGKSRLADEVGDRARATGHLVLWGRGWEDAGAPPYWPWVQPLRAYLRKADADDVRRQLGSGASDVAQMLPELRDLMPDLPPPRDAESDSARFRLFDSTATLLRNAAQDRPILIVIDDLQAADAPSILLVRFLASQLSDMSVLVVGTYRDVELSPEHPLTPAIEEVARSPATRVMTLGGLAAEAVADYLGRSVDIGGQDPLVAAVWRATSGNPLFVGEAVRLLSAEGRLGDVADLSSFRIAVPAGVRAVIARRIGHLGAPTTAALTVGAVIGPEFGLDTLRRVLEQDGDRALDLLDEAVKAGLLQALTGRSRRFRFSHDLVRETLYDELAPDRRAAIHRRIAEVLEQDHDPSASPHLAQLAFHFGQAIEQGADPADLHDFDEVARKAIDYARRAGDLAAQSLAFEEAARLHGMSLDVMSRTRFTDDYVRTEALLARGDVQSRAGDLSAARGTFLDAANIAKRTGVGNQLARAALGIGGRQQWARAGKDTRLIPMLQDALVVLGGSDDRLRARLLTRLSCAWRSEPDRRSDSDTLSRQAVDIARSLEDPASLIDALVGRFWATFWPENPAERESIAAETRRIGDTLADEEWLADALFLSYISLTERGHIAEARRVMEALGHVIEELRQPAEHWLVHNNRELLALLVGDFAEAEALIEADRETGYLVTPARDDVASARANRFLLRREQGRIAEEEASVRASIDDFPWYPLHRAALTCLLCDLGRTQEARVVFDDLALDAFSALYRDNEWLLGMGLASEACAMLRDAGAAAVLYEQLAPFAGRHAVGMAEGSIGAVDRYLGLLAATRGELDVAVAHLDAAIAINDAMGARPWSAHCEHDLAVVLRRRDIGGDRARADMLDTGAQSTATALGMALADQIGQLHATAWEGVDATSTTAVFRREGEYWTIGFDDATFRVRDSKGMRHLARLLSAPGREFHALELASTDTRSPRPVAHREVGPIVGLGDAGAILDPEAKAAYRARLTEIREELAEAERWNDPERVSLLADEQRALAHELASAVGLGGRDRVAASAAERARVSVTRAIRAALGRIREQSPGLGDHLDATIRTGTFCSYAPDPRSSIEWME
jgi:tetratricopeptide (TPR) repeat protein